VPGEDHQQSQQHDEGQGGGHACPGARRGFLEGGEPHGGNHEQANREQLGREEVGLPGGVGGAGKGQDHRGDAGSACGDGQSYEEAGIHDAHLHVEAGQAQGAAGHEHEGSGPADGPELRIGHAQAEESVAVGQDRGGHAEAQHIRKGIQLDAEF